MIRVAPSAPYRAAPARGVAIAGEWLQAVTGPGKSINLATGKGLWETRDHYEKPSAHVGIQVPQAGAPAITDIPNPDTPDGMWDPYAFMPRFAFEKGEDAFPVSPTFDGDTDRWNNAPAKPNGPGGSYQDGLIGESQALSGGFAVSRKGDYTVLTYSFNYAHNKAGGYHVGDWSLAQVYLKPGPDGMLAPSHLYTSWHHGGVLTPWHQLAKDAQGRPVITVQEGSHALQPVGRGRSWPQEGLVIQGDGLALVKGKPTAERLSFDVFQGNVRGATRLDPASPVGASRLETMAYGTVGLDPLAPESFKNSHPVKEFVARGWGWLKATAARIFKR